MAIQDVTDQTFQKDVLQSDKPVLVDFWAPWCGPCKMAAPVLEELSTEYNDKVNIVKVNVDDNQAISSQYGILSIPTTVLFKGGKEVDRHIGFAGKGPFEELIKKGF